MRRISSATILLSLCLVAAGCSGNGDKLNQSLSAYDGGRYEESLQLAEQARGEASTPHDALESSYVAGMSAFRLGRHADAVRWLEEPARATDAEHRWMSGQANVTLGSSYLSLGRKSDAARSFGKAATLLDGEDARKAHLAAGNAYRELGNASAANEEFRLAGAPTSTVSRPPASGPSGSSGAGTSAPAPSAVSQVGPFVLQAGAFRDREKAERRAAEVRTPSKQAGLGDPKVLAKRGADGGTMYVVQFGQFNDRRTAEAALGRVGLGGIVVGRPVA